MITVYKVSKAGAKDTRLHLPYGLWSDLVRKSLLTQGWAVEETDEPSWPDPRDAAELARRDELLELSGH